jgi:Winged helix DNA-binding domain
LRLRNQLLAGNGLATAREVVAHFGAMQAQDYLGALWAVGTRMKQATEADVERALADREIVRTWPLRGTLHFVAAEDVHWMLDFLAPRIIRRHAARQEREHGLTEAVLRRARRKARQALEGEKQLTREELYAALGVENGLQIVWRLAHEKLICFGPRRGKQQTVVLLDEWIPRSRDVAPKDPLAELARRYFQSHGPATAADFAWWAGITLSEARRVLPGEAEAPRASRGGVHLLPPFDEYTVAYKHRDDIIDPAFAKRVNAGGGMLNAVVVANGRVVGTWKRAGMQISLFRALTRSEERALRNEIARYERFAERR